MNSGRTMKAYNHKAFHEFMSQRLKGTPGEPAYDRAFLSWTNEFLGAQDTTIFRLQDDESLRITRTLHHDLTQFQNLKFRLGEGICGACAYSREPISIYNAPEEPRFDRRVNDKLGVYPNGMVAAPIIFQERLFGVLEALRFDDPEPFPDEAKHFLGILGFYYGAALNEVVANPKPRKTAPQPIPAGNPTTLVGASPLVIKALDLSRRFAKIADPVLIRGATGTGKELVARRIHEESQRSKQAFVDVNCAALPENLVESELFGHAKGAFSGATQAHSGLFQRAHRGTLFLDEIGEMRLQAQAKILRAIETQEITPVGSEQSIKLDTRILSATNRDLWAEAEQGAFRKDLFFRLSANEVYLPPLSERVDDIPMLINYFIQEAWRDPSFSNSNDERPTISESALAWLRSYHWPGNVRELRGVIRSMMTLTETNLLEPKHLPEKLQSAGETNRSQPQSEMGDNQNAPAHESRSSNEDLEWHLALMKRTAYPGTQRWNLSAAARELGIPRSTLDYRLRKMGLK